jgi:single-stranded-DNA-specific exonuclease
LKPQVDTGGSVTINGQRLSPLIRSLLAQRGLTQQEEIQSFLLPKLANLSDPFLLPNMQAAVDRILRAVDDNERVVLYGDYDVDGVTSMAVLHIALRKYGITTNMFLPHRMEEGYGVSRDGVTRVFEDFGRPDLFIALDCGTTSLTEMKALREVGVDVVIVDHHELSPDGPPLCEALVNPKLADHSHHFCTVGLVFKLVHALMKARRLENFDIKELLDLVTLGTVADLVPLIEENRILVRRGLELITQTKRPGLKALKTVAGVDGLVQTHHLGFRIGPRLNAAGRLDTAATSLEVLLAEDDNEAMAGAEMLDQHNRERQTVENQCFVEAEAQLLAMGDVSSMAGIVLASRGWHPGVVGIVASRISRLCHRPAILIAIAEDGMGKGSGRSIPGISLVEIIEECRHLLNKGGGHAMAIGLSVPEEKIPEFRQTFGEAVRQRLSSGDLRPHLEMDAVLELNEMSSTFLDQYKLMEPFGMGNPEPIFLCKSVNPRLPGRIMREKHLRVVLQQGAVQQDAIFFNAPLSAMPPPPWDVALRLQRNFYRGNESWQFTVEGIRAAESGNASPT